ncbi:MAG: 2,3-bisphosphoglycerate-dependent phosphoglycerate mutase [Alphaproteobacteria bacterium]|nr:2,3-bisphosphoglycerate-dependent phosphoglycerate mutase [Alphaproteobacteria bacterium]
MTNYLILLRHGQSQWNLENKFTGFTDVELTEEGRDEARKAGHAIEDANIMIDKVFSSTLKRANETAKLALDNAGSMASKVRTADGSYQMIRHDDLRERDYGDLTGLNKDDTRDKYGEEQVHIWRRSYDVSPPGGECLKDVVENRVRPYYKKEIKPLLDDGKNVLVAAHGNSLRAMLIVLGLETPDTINEAEMPTGKPLLIQLDDMKVSERRFL